MSLSLLQNYFSELSDDQLLHFEQLQDLYQDWNLKINVVSRKDIDELYIRHVLHSLGIAKFINFKPNSKVMDVGTGGGFPGIPLAIMFPETHFTLVDSIGKKIKVVEEVQKGLGLTNITAIHSRVEDVDNSFDFIVSRAVAAMPTFVRWTKGKIAKKNNHEIRNGIIYLKGGDLTEELADFPKAEITDLTSYFDEDFYETKKVVYLPIKVRN